MGITVVTTATLIAVVMFMSMFVDVCCLVGMRTIPFYHYSSVHARRHIDECSSSVLLVAAAAGASTAAAAAAAAAATTHRTSSASSVQPHLLLITFF